MSFARRAALCALLLGCRSSEPELTPRDVVTQYFHAAKTRNCAKMTALAGGSVAKKLKELGCEGLARSYEEHRLELLSIEKEEPDGRDPNAFVVHVKMKHVGKEGALVTRIIMTRVARSHGRLRLVEL